MPTYEKHCNSTLDHPINDYDKKNKVETELAQSISLFSSHLIKNLSYIEETRTSEICTGMQCCKRQVGDE